MYCLNRSNLITVVTKKEFKLFSFLWCKYVKKGKCLGMHKHLTKNGFRVNYLMKNSIDHH